MRSVIRPRARDDIIRQFRWYLVEQDAPDIARKFVDAVERTIGRLTRMPKTGAIQGLSNPALEGLRSWPVEGFGDIRIFYLVCERTVKVVRILHGRRDVTRILAREPQG